MKITRKLLQVMLFFACMFLRLPVAWSQAALLNYGQPVSGSLDAGQQIDYTFAGKVGDKPIITMNGHGGSMIPSIQLYDPQGRLIGEDSGSGPKGNALLKGFVLPADGTYKITALNQALSATGKYGLLVNEVKQQVYFDGTPTDDQSGKQNYQLSQPWDHKNITYHILNTLNGFSQQDVETVIAQAFQSWSNAAPITFTEVQGQGDINIQFGQIDGALNILGETCPPYNPCDSGSVTFDDAENWTLNQPQGYGDISLLGVASHELGHAIGMLHTDDPNALMYPEYSPYNLQPGQDDIAGVERLYGTGSGTASNPPSLPNAPSTNNQSQMTVSGQLSDQQYTHFWDFDVQAGDTVTITMSSMSGDLDSFLVLIDGNNNLLAYDDDSAGDKNAELAHLRFPQSGTYTVAATRYAQAQGYTSGTYSLSIEYDVGAGQAVPTVQANSPPVTGTGSVTVGNGQSSQTGQLASLDNILNSPFADSASPATQTRTGNVVASQSYVWAQTWCASDAQTLTATLANISVTFSVNDQAVDPSLVTKKNVSQNQLTCAQYFVFLSNWTPGNVSLTATLTLKQPVFDGQTIYSPGDYIDQYNLQAR